MGLRILNPELSLKIFELAQKPYRPKEIIDLKEEIEAKTRLAELRASFSGVIDTVLVKEIVDMKLRLDGLYLDWAEGKIS